MVEEIIIMGIRLVFALYCFAILIFFFLKVIDLREHLKVKDYIGVLTLPLIAIALILDTIYYDPEYWYEPAWILMSVAMVGLIVYCIMLLINLIKTKSKLKEYFPIIIIILTLSFSTFIPDEIYYANLLFFTIILYIGHFIWSFALLYRILLGLTEREFQERIKEIEIKEEKEGISEDIEITKDTSKFHVIKPKLANLVVLIFVMFILFIISFSIWIESLYFLIFVFAPIILITPTIWNRLGKIINNKLVIEGFQIWEGKKRMNPIRYMLNWIFGLNFSIKFKYFLSAEVVDLDLNEVKKFFIKLFDVVSACIGITFTIGTILKLSFSGENVILMLLIILCISPFLISWLIPVIWTVSDGHIRMIDEKHVISDIGEKMSKSKISRFLGMAGLALGFSFILDMAYLMEGAEDAFTRYYFAAIYLLLFISLIIGLSFLLGMIYIWKYHEKRVNEFRSKIANIPLPIGITIVRRATDEEKGFFLN